MHGSAVFLHQVVAFSRTWVVSWKISHTITCAIIFILYITSNHFEVIQWKNSESDGNQLIMALQGVVFMTKWF